MNSLSPIHNPFNSYLTEKIYDDALVKLAKDAKTAGQVELANQILNSAKFSAKTEFKKIAPET